MVTDCEQRENKIVFPNSSKGKASALPTHWTREHSTTRQTRKYKSKKKVNIANISDQQMYDVMRRATILIGVRGCTFSPLHFSRTTPTCRTPRIDVFQLVDIRDGMCARLCHLLWNRPSQRNTRGSESNLVVKGLGLTERQKQAEFLNVRFSETQG